ncbi:MAG TPA: dimethyl sulfoxide reductase anchor subunit [Burkholderiaceae bacterium]|nr:dimethyl sulfoxide reductase anchor subunit [Burkholderiaceae bacterium]
MNATRGSFGPRAWHQASWDWRAAANFVCGGAGAGLIAVCGLSSALGRPAPWPTLLGVLLVGFGLFAVWLEIGRPMRALHVFFNPRTSWMSREAFVAALLLPGGVAAAAGLPGFATVAALLALCFVWCQARILKAARGIPAWRQTSLVPLIVFTGLAEGTGLALVAALAHGHPARVVFTLAVLLATLAIVRWLAWLAYRRRLEPQADPRALAALDSASQPLLWAGTFAPTVLVAFVALFTVALGDSGRMATGSALLLALAGLGAIASGMLFKFTLVTRAAYNQGFALTRLPVRGARR